jgi:hypothetical protein
MLQSRGLKKPRIGLRSQKHQNQLKLMLPGLGHLLPLVLVMLLRKKSEAPAQLTAPLNSKIDLPCHSL